MDQSLCGQVASVTSFHAGQCLGRALRFLAVVAVLGVFGASRPAAAQCGDGIVETGEECDDGGTCIGGSNAGTHCNAESDCSGTGVCAGGSRARTVCASDAACPGGACRHCVPQGGDGCAANCTFEHDVPYPLVPGLLDGLNLYPGTSGVTILSDFLSIPLPFWATCDGGYNLGVGCAGNDDCPGGACALAHEVLTIGKERDGKIPVVVKEESVRFPGIPTGTLGCGCIRGAAAKTCGGAAFEGDGVTPSLDCTPGYTAGESVCTAAGKSPCTFVHGEGNTASGEIGCNGLDNINVSFSQDSGGTSGVAAPPMVTFSSGSGGPGSASVLDTIGITSALGPCVGTDPSVYGPDGIYCTPDDPVVGIISAALTSPAVTGVATAVVHNANGMDSHDLGPVTVSGAPFSCAALAQGSAAGGGLVEAFAFVHLDTVGDVGVSAQFFGSGTAPPAPVCGNGSAEADEECDDGGTCIGGTNAGTHCSAESDCTGTGECVGGTRARTACADDAACPGGACRHCVPQGGDGCAANCTLEQDVPYLLVPGMRDNVLLPGTSGAAIFSDFLSLPLPLGAVCDAGANMGEACVDDRWCPQGKCAPARQILTVGKERNGKLPVVVKARSVMYPCIDLGNLSVGCIRGVAAKTCGGVAFEADGVTPATDCTPGFTVGDSLCSATGKPLCTFVHGDGNTMSGEVGCDGLDNINVNFSQDSGGASGLAGPPTVTLSGSGGPGSASVLNTIGTTVALGNCTGTDLSVYGPDGIFCTADDPPGGIVANEYTSPAVTGVAQAQVLNANGADGVNLPPAGPVTAAGAPFSCTALASGSAAGAGLVQAFPLVHLDTVGDVIVSAQFFASAATAAPTQFATATPTATATVTPVVSPCRGDCDRSGAVSTSDLLTLVHIALGNLPLSACARGDADASGDINVNDIIVALNSMRHGCSAPTPLSRPYGAP